MRIELARLHDDLDATMIYVTHDQVEAMTLADKIVVLQGGVIEQAGSPLELYHHPENLFVAGFIGSPKDELPGRKAVGGGRLRRHDRAGQQGPDQGDVARPGRPKGSRSRSACVPSTCGSRAKAASQRRGPGRERLGGETYLYTQITDGVMLVVQADGENATRVHDRIGVVIDGPVCHLFKQDGSAVRPRQASLADIKDPTAHAA